MSLSKTPIQELGSDYVLSVSYPLTNGKSDPSAEQALQSVLEALYKADFATQVRPGNANEILVFIRLSSAKFVEESEKDLIKNYEFGITASDNSHAARLRIVYNYLLHHCLSPDNQSIVYSPFVKAVVPVNIDSKTLIEEVKTQMKSRQLTTDAIKEKYGVRVALYFEYMKSYITWLAVLGTSGFISYFTAKNRKFSLTFTFINLLWGTIFITYWTKRQEYLVNSWGVQNSHLLEEHYAEVSQINKNFEKKSTFQHKGNSEGHRYLKQLSFVPVALGFTAVLVAYQLGCFVLEIFLSEIYDGPAKILLTLLPTILIVGFVPILTIVYNLVAKAAIAWENHDNEYSKDNSIIVKSFVLTFLTSYMPLIITSFVYLPFAHLIEPHLGDIKAVIDKNIHSDYFFYKYLTQLKRQEDFKINQQRLSAQYFYFIVTNQVIQLIVKYALPIAISFVKSKLDKNPQPDQDRQEEKVWLTKIRKIVSLPEYNVHDDFRAITMQFGYLALFGPVWPLAPLVCIVFNIITFKLDTFKLESGQYFRPPVPVRDDSIHPWDHALFLLAWIGSVISPIVTVFYRHGITPPKTLGQFSFDKASINVPSAVWLVFVVFVSEHLFFIVHFVGAKVAKLFKSDIEWKNDFTENDLKLRRDYYSGTVKPTFELEDDGEWAVFTAKDSILAAEKFSSNSTKPEEEIETLPTTSANYSTSADSELGRSLERKRHELNEKRAELERLTKENLDKVKDEGDTVISVPNEKHGAQLSTIDSNKHADEEDVKLEDNVDEKVAKQTHVLDSPGSGSSGSGNSSSTSRSSFGKKRSLKKLFKGKK